VGEDFWFFYYWNITNVSFLFFYFRNGSWTWTFSLNSGIVSKGEVLVFFLFLERY
jgi:hypothetical protein